MPSYNPHPPFIWGKDHLFGQFFLDPMSRPFPTTICHMQRILRPFCSYLYQVLAIIFSPTYPIQPVLQQHMHQHVENGGGRWLPLYVYPFHSENLPMEISCY